MPAITIDKNSPPEFTSTAPSSSTWSGCRCLLNMELKGAQGRVKLWYRVVRARTWVMGGSEASSWFNIV